MHLCLSWIVHSNYKKRLLPTKLPPVYVIPSPEFENIPSNLALTKGTEKQFEYFIDVLLPTFYSPWSEGIVLIEHICDEFACWILCVLMAAGLIDNSQRRGGLTFENQASSLICICTSVRFSTIHHQLAFMQFISWATPVWLWLVTGIFGHALTRFSAR